MFRLVLAADAKMNPLYSIQSEKEGQHQGSFREKDGRHTVPEIPMPGFVAEEMHAEGTAQGSAQ